MLAKQLHKCVFIGGVVALIMILQVTGESLQVSEADQMALEISEVMLPPKKLSRTIAEQLEAIRKFNPAMREIVHSPKWAAGELIVAAANENTIRTINASRYGPIKVSQNVDMKSSDMGPSGEVYKLVFSKPYHPARLVERMHSELKIKEIEANLKFGRSTDVKYHETAPLYNTYTFKLGWGDCASECTYNHYWEYTVAPSDDTYTVKLEKEYGSDLSLRNL